jgi:hypothetical protein
MSVLRNPCRLSSLDLALTGLRVLPQDDPVCCITIRGELVRLFWVDEKRGCGIVVTYVMGVQFFNWFAFATTLFSAKLDSKHLRETSISYLVNFPETRSSEGSNNKYDLVVVDGLSNGQKILTQF